MNSVAYAAQVNNRIVKLVEIIDRLAVVTEG